MGLRHRKELISNMFRVMSADIERCYAAPLGCVEPAIRAHSVQNARVLALLEEKGHVVVPETKLDISTGPSTILRKVGRNKATTFAGLCARHDQELFAPIDTGSLDPGDPEQQFLLAYRAAYFESHATVRAAWQVQTGYLKRVELGLDPKDEPSPSGMFAVDRMMVAYETHMFKAGLDEAYVSRRFNVLSHDLLTLTVTEPTVAASALFSLDERRGDRERILVGLNVLPLSQTRTIALFSYRKGDAKKARHSLRSILRSSGDRQLYEVSRRLLNNCANFALSPRYVDSWPLSKRAEIVSFFTRTALRDELEYEHPDLVLFR